MDSFPFPQTSTPPPSTGRGSRSTRSAATGGAGPASGGAAGKGGSGRSQSETSSAASPPGNGYQQQGPTTGGATSAKDGDGGSSLPTDPKARRRERNRLAASAFRTRKKERFEVLESRLSGLEDENRNLRAEVQRLRSQLAATGNAPAGWIPGASAGSLASGVSTSLGGSGATIGSLLSNVNLAQLGNNSLLPAQSTTYHHQQQQQPKSKSTQQLQPQININEASTSPVELAPIETSNRPTSAEEQRRNNVTLPSFNSPGLPHSPTVEDMAYSFNEVDQQEGTSSSTFSKPPRSAGFSTGFSPSRDFHNDMSGKENERGLFLDDVSSVANGQNGKHQLSPGSTGFTAKRAKMSPRLALPPLSMPLTSPHLSPHLPLTTAASLLLGNRTPTPTATYLHTLQNALTSSGGKTSSIRDGPSNNNGGGAHGGYFSLGRSERGYSERSSGMVEGEERDDDGGDDEL